MMSLLKIEGVISFLMGFLLIMYPLLVQHLIYYLAKDLLEKMLQRDPTKRITASQALKHHYFAKFNQQMMMDDGTIDDEDDEGGLGNKINKLREE